MIHIHNATSAALSEPNMKSGALDVIITLLNGTTVNLTLLPAEGISPDQLSRSLRETIEPDPEAIGVGMISKAITNVTSASADATRDRWLIRVTAGSVNREPETHTIAAYRN